MFLHNCWYMAGWTEDFAQDRLTPRMLLNQPIVLFRKTDGILAALEDRCCHKLAPLSRGRQERDDIRCMYHGLKFDATGRCIEIPGQPIIPRQVRVRSYPIVERHSAAWIWMGDPEHADQSLIPEFVGVHDPRWSMRPGRMDYRANYRLVHDNLLDLSHISYVHRSSFGGDDPPAIDAWANASVEVTRLERGVRVGRWIQNTPGPPYVRQWTGHSVDLWTTYDFVLPGVFLLHSAYYRPGAAERSGAQRPSEEPVHASFTCQAITPLTDKTSCYFFAFGPWSKTADLAELYLQMALKAFTEDQRMIEAQQLVIDSTVNPRMIPLAMDRAPNLFRRLLDQLIAAEAAGASGASVSATQLQAEG